MPTIALSFLLLAVLESLALCADGRYFVGKDTGGVYVQTEQDGGWYIDREDLKFFKVGEIGTYSTGKDSTGTYLSAEGRKFYLDMEAKSKLVKETQAFNAAEEKRLRDLREDEIKRQQNVNRKEPIGKEGQQSPKPAKLEIHITREGYDEDSRIESWGGPVYLPFPRSRPTVRPNDSHGPNMPSPAMRPGTPSQGTGEFPWWKGTLNPRF